VGLSLPFVVAPSVDLMWVIPDRMAVAVALRIEL